MYKLLWVVDQWTCVTTLLWPSRVNLLITGKFPKSWGCAFHELIFCTHRRFYPTDLKNALSDWLRAPTINLSGIFQHSHQQREKKREKNQIFSIFWEPGKRAWNRVVVKTVVALNRKFTDHSGVVRSLISWNFEKNWNFGIRVQRKVS